MTLYPNWDVIVVGAGPAGSVAALELARRGVSVLLVDRAVFPRSKVCGCCLNRAALSTLDAIGLREFTTRLGAIPFDHVRLAAGRHQADVPFAGVAVSREALDTALCDAAVEAGVTLCQGVRAVLGPYERDRPIVWLHRQGRRFAVTARVIVAANGLAGRLDPSSPAFSSINTLGSRIGAGVAIPRENVPDFYAPGRVYMATGHGGYAGLVQLEDGRLDVGACLDVGFVRTTGSPAAVAGAILESVGWPLPPNFEQMPWKGTPPLTRRPQEVAGRRWFAIGDAAGYVEPFTGEGMAWAIQSAVAIVPLAVRAVEGWNEAMIGEWSSLHSRLFRGRHRLCRSVAHILRFPGSVRMLVRLLSAAPLLARPLAARLNRPVITFRKAS